MRCALCRGLTIALLVGLAVFTTSPAAHACGAAATLEEVNAYCEFTEAEAEALVNSGDGHSYSFVPIPGCELDYNDGECQGYQTCAGPPVGIWHYVYVDGASEPSGRACLSDGFDAGAAVVSTQMILTAFQELSWPAPTLHIQPPGGKTLVNLETIFSTDLEGPVTQTVTLLGQQIDLTATPVRYTWHPGDGTSPWTTHGPGTPWTEGTDATTLNHHVYADAHVTVTPHATVTYQGTYRINNGPEQPLPGEHTVTGPTVQLAIAEAIPTLVG